MSGTFFYEFYFRRWAALPVREDRSLPRKNRVFSFIRFRLRPRPRFAARVPFPRLNSESCRRFIKSSDSHSAHVRPSPPAKVSSGSLGARIDGNAGRNGVSINYAKRVRCPPGRPDRLDAWSSLSTRNCLYGRRKTDGGRHNLCDFYRLCEARRRRVRENGARNVRQ